MGLFASNDSQMVCSRSYQRRKTRQRRQPLAYSKRRKMSETNKKEIKEEVNL